MPGPQWHEYMHPVFPEHSAFQGIVVLSALILYVLSTAKCSWVFFISVNKVVSVLICFDTVSQLLSILPVYIYLLCQCLNLNGVLTFLQFAYNNH